MCLHRSYVVTEDYKVLDSKESDHHTEIRRLHGIRDDYHAAEVDSASIEFHPVTNLFDLPSWRFSFDEPKKPNWWTKEHMDKVQKKLEQDYMKYAVQDSTYVFPGELDLRELERFHTEGTTIVVGGSILLGVDCLPPNTTIIAKNGAIVLPNVRHCYPRCTLIARRVEALQPESIRSCVVINDDRLYPKQYVPRQPSSMSYQQHIMRQPIPPSIATMFPGNPFIV